MRKLLRQLPLLALVIVLSSCQVKKQMADNPSVKSEILYQQALKALDEGMFIIEGEEFYFPSVKRPVKISRGSYISMQNPKAVINFTPDVFPKYPWTWLIIEDNAAQLTKGKTKKNGDLQFHLKVEGNQEWLRRNILITLYKGTNECFVRVNNRAGSNLVDFKGKIYPEER